MSFTLADFRKKSEIYFFLPLTKKGFATPQAIYKWQQGAAIPAIDNLVVLSVVFGVAIDDIIVLENDSVAARIA